MSNESMKDTGIRWIGAIPSDWSTKRIKYMAKLKGRIGWQGLTSDEYQDEGAFLITGTDFDAGHINWDTCVHVPMSRWEEARDIQIENGDLLITKDGTVGKVALVDNMPGETSLNSGVLRIMPKDGYSSRFLFWVLHSEEFWNWFNYKNAGNSTITHLYQGDFAEFIYAFPDYNEQEAIATILDQECGERDKAIVIIEKQIEVLKKYKQRFITEAVTKGIDRTVPMKYSGVDGLGTIPEHWKVKRLKYILEENGIKVGPFGSALSTEDYCDKGKWVYDQRIVLDNNFVIPNALVSEEKFKQLRNFKVFPGDILLTTRGTIGKTALVPENAQEGILHPCIIRFRINSDILLPELVNIIFNESNIVINQLKDMSNATTIDVIYSYSLKEVRLPIIPKDEQFTILEYIINRGRQIEEIRKRKDEQLELLKKQKQSLIYEYVTGKKRIKEVQ